MELKTLDEPGQNSERVLWSIDQFLAYLQVVWTSWNTILANLNESDKVSWDLMGINKCLN